MSLCVCSIYRSQSLRETECRLVFAYISIFRLSFIDNISGIVSRAALMYRFDMNRKSTRPGNHQFNLFSSHQAVRVRPSPNSLSSSTCLQFPRSCVGDLVRNSPAIEQSQARYHTLIGALLLAPRIPAWHARSGGDFRVGDDPGGDGFDDAVLLCMGALCEAGEPETERARE